MEIKVHLGKNPEMKSGPKTTFCVCSGAEFISKNHSNWYQIIVFDTAVAEKLMMCEKGDYVEMAGYQKTNSYKDRFSLEFYPYGLRVLPKRDKSGDQAPPASDSFPENPPESVPF